MRVQERIRSKKDPESREAVGTSQLLKTEKPRDEGAEAYKEQEKPRSGSNSKNHKNIKNKSI